MNSLNHLKRLTDANYQLEVNRVGLMVSCFFLKKKPNLSMYEEASQIKSKKHPKKMIKKPIARIVLNTFPINSMAL